MLACKAAADACAEGSIVGVGGWFISSNSVAWFAETWQFQEVQQQWPCLTKEAQRYIARFETLAQLALMRIAWSCEGQGVRGVQHGVVRAGKFPVLTKLSRAPCMGGCVPTWYAALQIMVLRQQHMHPAHGQQMHASTKTRQRSWSSGKLRPVPEHAYSRIPGKSCSKFDQTLRVQSEHAARGPPQQTLPAFIAPRAPAAADRSIPQPNHPLTIVARAWLHWKNSSQNFWPMWAPATHPLLSRNSNPRRQHE